MKSMVRLQVFLCCLRCVGNSRCVRAWVLWLRCEDVERGGTKNSSDRVMTVGIFENPSVLFYDV